MTFCFDAHIHLEDNWWAPEEIIRLMDKGRMFCDNTVREKDWTAVLKRAEASSSLVPFIGLHPWYADTTSSDWEHTMRFLLHEYPHAGVGEIGLDRCCKIPFTKQLEVFRLQLRLAVENNRPVSVHCVRAWGKLLEELEKLPLRGARIMIHGFAGSVETMHRLVRHGMYCSFSPMLCTERGQKIFPAIEQIPEEYLLLESDAPGQLLAKQEVEDHILTYANTMDALYQQVASIRRISQEKLREQIEINGAVFTNATITG
ncbi:TatD family hydrolase [Desulfogranum japonicum]|uniref:TatD family hydrolase n=1 Tax=Desulfogranum japonicum TaxID=231447 RepID=UPI000410C640|nr:TatD family hydrolase [Desulfogranum japonicum]